MESFGRNRIAYIGALYLDGQPSETGAVYDGTAKISLGDTNGKSIPWIERGGKYAALRSVLSNISWTDLDENYLTYGSRITIDGEEFFCRLPRLGSNAKEPNEWETFFAEMSPVEKGFFVSDIYSWGLDTPGDPAYRVVRHKEGMAGWDRELKCKRQPVFGWRPILEPILPALSSIQKGTRVRVRFKDGSMLIDGKLEGYSDYDILLGIRGPISSDSTWCKTVQPGLIAVDRAWVSRVTPLRF